MHTPRVAPFTTAMRRLVLILVLASMLSSARAVSADDCPTIDEHADAVDASCVNALVPTVDGDGRPIPFVEEVIAAPDGIALSPGDS